MRVASRLRRTDRAPTASAWSWGGGRRCWSSARTEPARRPCCASSPPCCDRAAARSRRSVARSPASLEAARADRLPRPRAAALPRPQRPRDLRFHARLHGSAARRPRRGSRSCCARSAWSAAPTSASPSSRPGCASGWRSAAVSCTRRLCCSTSPTPTSTPKGASWQGGPSARRRRTRVIVSHDPERFEARGRPSVEAPRGRRKAGSRFHDSLTNRFFAAILAKDLRGELRSLQSLPAMALFAVTTFVIFRFGLDRTSLSGSLASGCSGRRCSSPLCSASTGSSSPSARRAVSTRSASPRSTAASLFAAKAAALLVYLLALELIVVPVFALFFLDSAAALGPLARGPRPRRPRPGCDRGAPSPRWWCIRGPAIRWDPWFSCRCSCR